jgi:sugar lactone lactonase YvrE
MRTVTPEFEVIAAVRATTGESPVWDAECSILRWVDIDGRKVYSYDPSSRKTAHVNTPADVGLLAKAPCGDWFVALGCDIAKLHADGRFEPIATAPAASKDFRFNDGKFDLQGRLYAGLMSRTAEAGSGALYRLDPDGTWTVLDAGFTLPNGLAWSPDGKTFFYNDSLRRETFAYEFDLATGDIAYRRRFAGAAQHSPSRPDGLTFDPQGYLLSVAFDDHGIIRFAPDGTIERRLKLPIRRPTCCAFSDDGATLYVTSARIGLSEEELRASPLSGATLASDYASAFGQLVKSRNEPRVMATDVLP